MPTTTHQYVRSPHLVVTWSTNGLVAENVADCCTVSVTPFVLDVLDRCQAPQSTEALAEWYGVSSSKMAAVVRRMVQTRLLRTGDPVASQRDATCGTWDTWAPARLFHVATKDVQFWSPAKRARHARSVRAKAPRPPITKLTRGPFQRLLAPRRGGEFHSVLVQRRTWRKFDRSPVRLADLSTLLNLTAGIQSWTDTREGPLAFKTSPSGGARHPTETYVAALRCEGIRRGLYHYAPDRHGLTRINDIGRREIRRFLPQQDWYASAGAIVFFTSMVARTMWRYPYARAYRALLLEIGHVCQTFCLTATWLGLAPFCTQALADSAIEQKLGIDGTSEIVLYAAGVGCRPKGVEWAPKPDNRRYRLIPHRLS